MLVGYMRVSKADGSQTTDPQRDALVEAGVDDERLYEDRASGRRDDRPGLVACLKSLRAGDTPVVWKLDRLGRDLRHLVNTVHSLNHVRVPGRGRPPVGGAWSRRKGAGHVADLLDEAKGAGYASEAVVLVERRCSFVECIHDDCLL